ncbi:hypothetical protein K502DRAFT_202820 [Neoconidiobolus thromboides FSU 785]|nr:hypothetical protein K502DRAFT_202820 [Neoconidiobolus thromboides FSU 785]
MTSQEKKDKMELKSASEYYEPCEFESKRSLKCLQENYLNKSKCNDLFQEYRDCKKYWVRFMII